ncbi:MAG: CmpA/NrtA family ABC transporter substrate-binding protein [Opitutaceae bacterium]|jgi:ABC-type nitrate/sulfonate/bicarbonate transport system substrate-binding protein
MSAAKNKVRPAAAIGRPLKVGFIPLNDAAPLIVAHEHGFFQRHGLQVELCREVGWATIRDKIIYRELDAAHSLGAMVIATTLGLGCVPCECLTALVLNTHGNCITLSEDLWKLGVRDAATMHDAIIKHRHERTFVFGVVFNHSSHHILLCDWLAGGGIDPQKDVRIVIVPPPQLFRNLSAGTIDGYCVGDPWCSLAVREKIGWCAAISRELAPNHAEKVLMVRRDFAETHSDEHLALVAAVAEAAELCDDPAFRPELVGLLARREYLNVPARVIHASLVGPFDLGHERSVSAEHFIHFHGDGANDPTSLKSDWIIDRFTRHGLIPRGLAVPADLGRRTFRSDLFKRAIRQFGESAVGA